MITSNHLVRLVTKFLIFISTDTATSKIYTLSLHDALPIFQVFTFYPGASPDVMASSVTAPLERQFGQIPGLKQMLSSSSGDRKSTRLNSSHMSISYAVFCLKKKKIWQIL